MELSSFFNSVRLDGVGDRVYKAEDWAAYFASFIGNGVYPTPTDGLKVVENVEGGLSVVLSIGSAWINGYFYRNTEKLIIPLENADGVLNRIDRIVIQWNLTERKISAKVKSSALASIPVAPALQRDNDAFELCVADVTVSNGATRITNANIKDRRFDGELCGIVTGVIQQIDFTSITAQFDSFFDQYVNLVESEFDQYNSVMSAHTGAAQLSYDEFVAALNDHESDALADYQGYENRLNTFETNVYNMFGEWFGGIQTDLETTINEWFQDYTSTLGPDEAIQLFNKLYNHEQLHVTEPEGVHGIRYQMDTGQVQIDTGSGWVTVAVAVRGYSWAFIDSLDRTCDEWDALNLSWDEFENLIEAEAT